jgi:peptide/nickel transport system permease protein
VLIYAGRRLLSTALVLFLASIVVFGVLRLTPGSPADVLAGPDASPQTVANITDQLGLNKPLTTQYVDWLSGVVHGSFGKSYILGAPIGKLISQRLGNTLELMAAAMALSILFGGLFGLAAATARAGPVRALLAIFNTISLTIPTFITGIVLILVFAVRLRMLPAGGHISITHDPVGGLRSLVMPAVTLALPLSAVIARFLATSLRQELDREYVQAAVAKGLTRRRIFLRHLLPNALPPVITVTGIQIGQLIGGAVVVEAIFSWPGLAQLSVQALLQRDYLVVQDVLLFAVVVFVVIQIATDLAQAAIDPRTRARS